ncbi:FCD domain-containing protein [Jannaschia sp.]|nr:FCD domain-containing protein [Jannaschia sp.]
MTDLRDRLLDLIAAGELGADGRLPPERALADRFGATRRALRQTLDGLEEEGLVWRRQGSGTFAGRPSDPTGDLAARIAGETDPLQVMEARLCIEPTLAALCAERMTGPEIARLRALAARQVETADPQAIEVWDGALHRMIADCARNRPLRTSFALLDRIRAHPDWVALRARARSGASVSISLAEHAQIVEAIAARDPVRAQAAMHAHLSTRFAALRRESVALSEIRP